MKTLTLPRMLALNAYWVGLSFKWNALHPIVLPVVLLNYVPEAAKNTALGLLTFAGLLIAMVIQPLAGALSDGWASRWGRRRPLMVLGTAFDLGFLSLLAWGGGLTWLVLGYIGLQFSSNLAQGPAQGLLPDRVPPGQLGSASSWKNFMDMASLVVVSLLAGQLLDEGARDATTIMLVLIAAIALSTAITVLGTPEDASTFRRGAPGVPEAGTASPAGLRALRDEIRSIDFHANRAYWWLIAGRGTFLLGIYGVQAFAQYYLQDVLRVADPAAQTGNLLAVLTSALVVLVLAGGWLADRYGARRVLAVAGGLAATGMLLMPLPRSMPGLMAASAILGAGIGLFLTANWALATRLAPGEQAGAFLGLTNLATAGSSALARLEGPVLDWLNGTWPGRWVGYTAMFAFGAVCILVSLLFLNKIDDRRPEHR